MATDVYVKFGESKNRSPVYDTPLPMIEGDSDDAEHHWWCEVRDCGFDLENPGQEESEGSDSESKEPRSWFKTVTIKKRVDWGSTQLFLKCCEAAEAAANKSDDAQGKGLIDQVTVHVCRPSGGTKIPFLIVRYFNVQITHYEVEMSDPEPAEEIRFEFEAVEFEYQRTDPYTGATTGDAVRVKLKNYVTQAEVEKRTAPAAAPAVAVAAASTGGSGGSAAPAPAPPPAPAPGGNGALQVIASPTEVAVTVNFPGYSVGVGAGTFD